MIVFKKYTSTGATTTSLTATRPSGTILEGDLLIAHITADNHTSGRETITKYPSGWEKVQDSKGVSDNSHAVLYKVATSNEPTTYTFNFNYNDEFSVNIGHFSTDSGQPVKLGIQTSNSRTGVGSSTAISLSMEFLCVSFFTGHSSSSFSIPSGMSMAWNTRPVSYTGSSVGYKWMPSGGSTGVASVSNADKCISIAIVIMNQPPTKPGNVLGISENDFYLNGESVEISWSGSTDPEGDIISYEIEFTVDGSNWYSVMKDVTSTSKLFKITNKDTDVAQFRIRAKDDKGGYSGYSYSSVFKTSKKVHLIQDGNTVLTYKDGIWKVI